MRLKCWHIWNHRWNGNDQLFVLLVLRGVQSELGEFLAHFQPGDTQPAGGFGLVAVRQADGLAEQFRFKVGDHSRVSVLDFALLRARQQFGDVGRMGLVIGGGLRRLGDDLLGMFEADGKRPGQQQGLAHDIFQFPHIAGPGLVLQKGNGFRLNGGRLESQFPGIALDEVLGQLRNVLRALAKGGSVMVTTLSR